MAVEVNRVSSLARNDDDGCFTRMRPHGVTLCGVAMESRPACYHRDKCARCLPWSHSISLSSHYCPIRISGIEEARSEQRRNSKGALSHVIVELHCGPTCRICTQNPRYPRSEIPPTASLHQSFAFIHISISWGWPCFRSCHSKFTPLHQNFKISTLHPSVNRNL
jgi:hypothetical protein